MTDKQKLWLPYRKLDTMLTVLRNWGYQTVGPQTRDGAIVYDDLDSADELPWGVYDVQNPGEYRLEQSEDQQAFSWNNGPQAIKPLLFKPKEPLWRVERDDNGALTFKEVTEEVNKTAVIGVRACDLAGMAVQDRTFIDDQYVDEKYQKRRQNLFLVAVNCVYSGNNCFCVSTGDGPQCTHSYDLVLTELTDGFVAEAGSESGQTLVDELDIANADHASVEHAQSRVDYAARTQTKKLPDGSVRDIIFNNLDHPQWENVAERCLSCGNCVMVCPTCFCHHETEVPSLDGSSSEHQRQWDSCFTAGHSYFGGHVLRDDTKSRYKQWLTHKLASWWDQFGTSGCIGCGRCITWCPVGIDLTEEVAALAQSPNQEHE